MTHFPTGVLSDCSSNFQERKVSNDHESPAGLHWVLVLMLSLTVFCSHTTFLHFPFCRFLKHARLFSTASPRCPFCPPKQHHVITHFTLGILVTQVSVLEKPSSVIWLWFECDHRGSWDLITAMLGGSMDFGETELSTK